MRLACKPRPMWSSTVVIGRRGGGKLAKREKGLGRAPSEAEGMEKLHVSQAGPLGAGGTSSDSAGPQGAGLGKYNQSAYFAALSLSPAVAVLTSRIRFSFSSCE